ncbi:MAG TPA: hypothetical protein VGQ53_25210 [Chitinophagaceae bacterium]|jgi:hypothetical protein|nr:hypothetical protein [Chitinophagaceae bacterium]
MKKIFYIFLLLSISSISATAQNPVAPGNGDKKIIQNLIVQIRTAPGNTYLFDILDGPIVLNMQMRNNPATLLPKGFASKDGAFNVAEWMITQYKKDGHLPNLVPPYVLDSLKINKEELYKN